jgi:tetratricopeptide (TPR) repeat protein
MSGSSPGTIAELLLGQAAARSTGIVTISRGQVKKQLFLRDGDLISAESNLREEALGELLVALGLLSPSRLNQLLQEVKRRGQRMGTVLIELGWVTPDDVLAALREQVRRRATNCLRFEAVDASFEATSAFVGTIIEHRFELPLLIFCGFRDHPALDLLTPKLDFTPEAMVHLAPRFSRWRAPFDTAFGPDVARILERPAALGELVVHPEAGALLYGLEALVATGLVEITVPAPGAASGVVSAPVSRPSEHEHSGFLAPTPTTSSVTGNWRAAPGSVPEPGEFPGHMALEYLQLHGKSPGEVLGVGPAATRQEIDEAYARKLAAVDRAAAGTDLHPKLAEMIEAYARAHAALQTPATPESAPTTAAPAAPPVAAPTHDPLGAELAFGEGRGLLDAGRSAEAVVAFRRAVDRRPDQAAYHAWLGWTLFHVQGRGALPEALDRLEHAVAVDPDSVDGHALLGAVLIALRDPIRARQHLERTLALRPEQPDSIDRLARLYVELGEPEQAERLYRRIISALGERELPLRRTLWKELAELYEGPLVDPEGAARAYQMASRLAPDDAQLRRKAALAARNL